jgi:DNA (cytosine-5)-methyltransferase 1
MSNIRVVSLFCGCGGADLGLLGGFSYLGKRYKKLPYKIVHASDLNSKAVQTYNNNFKHQAEVLDVKELNLPEGFADFVVGGFPCQPFSTVNPTKDPSARESQLFWEMARVISDVRPKVFIAENVQGFYRLKGGYYFDLACSEFNRLGYNISHQLIDCSDYGVPQKRKRIFIVGVRSDLKKVFKFPNTTHEDHSSKSPKVPLSAVIKSLIPSDEKYFFSKRAVEGVKKAKPNMKRALAQDLRDQCLTITSHLAKVSLNSRDPVLLVSKEKELYRRFTPKEASAIQSFPNNFEFTGSEGDAYRQIGNAIPPIVMWHIARSIAALIDE